MISKERLEELIKEGATIYFTYSCENKIEEITLDKDYSIGIVYGVDCLMQKHYNDEFGENFAGGIELIDLFETKEDAEFALRYKKITRIETLSLPTWEEIIKEIGMNGTYHIVFTSKDEWAECNLSVCTSRQHIIIDGYKCYKYWDLSKENYLEACELCRKLFLGEDKRGEKE
ncbi:MAG: hypothetical protein SPK94_07890 [Bacteroidales bacterium]|nr:hypothetical protein [Bacteroidales bacterium]